MKRYNPKDIEPRWQEAWDEQKIYKARDFDKRQKFVMLTEFPYPSGDGLHLGHTREYTLGDVMARHKRMQGYNVLYPMGYDAFGLPTENYAIKNKITPQVASDRNIANFQKQFESLGFSIDWERSFRTADPAYYKWTQWLFLQFYKAGLAYQDEIAINWCPHCKTGLANEEVVNGRHERCDTLVEKKFLKQWLLKITQYADRLLDGLQDVDYPSRIADQQTNWIGRSKGAEVSFKIEGSDRTVQIFTTRPDTLFGATFMVLAPEHELVERITSAGQRPHVYTYLKAVQGKSDIERQDANREKTGVFTGAYAINPVNDARIPIWIADYVLSGYGTGAIMAVPAHDERDWEFATKFDLPIMPVLTPSFTDNTPYSPEAVERPTVIAVGYHPGTDKYCMLDWKKSGFRKGLDWPDGGIDEGETTEQAAVREFAEEAGYHEVTVDKTLPAAVSVYYRSSDGTVKRAAKSIVLLTVNSLEQGDIGKDHYEKNTYEVRWLSKNEILAGEMFAQNAAIRDFVFGRPIHVGEGVMINSGAYDNLSSDMMREKIVADLEKRGVAKERINYKLRDWIFSRQHYWGEPIPIIHCKEHGAVAVPDDQLPVELPVVEHYEPTDTGESPLAAIEEWVNTTCPTCGKPAKRETDTMPNWAGSSWYYLRYFDAHNDQAFADRAKLDYWGAVDLYLGGMEHTTLHLLYSRFWHQFLYDQGLVPTPEPYKARRGQGIVLAADGSKMSKSKGNVVNPNEVLDSGYGADALRLTIAFLAPYDQTTPWGPEGVAGTFRFLQRVWALAQDYMGRGGDVEPAEDVELKRTMHRAIHRVSKDLNDMGFNTAIAGLMETVNELYKLKVQIRFEQTPQAWGWVISSLLQLLAPFAPHMTEELWEQLGKEGSIHTSEWPAYDEQYLMRDTITIVVQVNGKVRAQVEVASDATKENILEAARANERIREYLQDKEAKKTIYVPGKLVNFVV